MGKQIPKDRGLDSTLKVLKEGYKYVPNRLEKFDTNIFELRALGGRRTVVISGKEAAELFYNNELTERQGTLPKRVVNTLFGKGAIHTTGGKKHIDRKALFMSLMTEENLDYLRELTRSTWFMNTERMERMDEVNVYKESIILLTKVGFRWAGIIASPEEIESCAQDMDTMIDSFKNIGTVFKGYREAKQARARVETFLENQIIAVREGKLTPPQGTALHEFSHWEDFEGNLMDSRLCAIDLMNVVRPLVAINRFISFGVKALHDYPGEAEKVFNNEDDYAYKFVQEIRRFYPFVPFLPGKAAVDIEFEGYTIEKDTFLVLDIYGTLHREGLWENPERFYPNRFSDWDGSPFDLIPQGGGDYHTNHRCAGEWMTLIIMEESMKYFARNISYDVKKDQDLSVNLNKLPGRVVSGTIIENVNALVNRNVESV
ncbi:cytochrome P450 [Mammaliicoccus vitulinus]|uniref:Cytochrome P450 n=3 Tax=Mammaliicoccus vitulinus TaxID=71237 RepID=A0ABX7HEK5_9STAP|nr:MULTISPECIES: cytochrome P450 [Mammaliicoccus]MBM6628701.1 cytochrome P450 [Mammaliicoccus vitulinus]MBO3076822.1 cytochrome P450 [Mammaliicoccus vitulinus]MEB7656495.1 cytochrome P450 [Mammaliicoccus vitulinus]PNZ38249.1 cytochrome P450 [Mammaliicoccus vitulinus]QJF24867.1 cytochrome P450 [Mammaliicoccus vitulinus]